MRLDSGRNTVVRGWWGVDFRVYLIDKTMTHTIFDGLSIFVDVFGNSDWRSNLHTCISCELDWRNVDFKTSKYRLEVKLIEIKWEWKIRKGMKNNKEEKGKEREGKWEAKMAEEGKARERESGRRR